MKRFKHVIVLLLLVAISINLVACGASDSPDNGDSKGTIAVLTYVTSAPYFSHAEDAIKETGKKLGYDVIYTGTPEVDTPKYISLIQDMIQRDVKAIVVASADSTSVAPVLREAREKGIIVVSWDLDVVEDARDAYAGIMDLSNLGIPMVDEMVNAMGDEGEFAILTGVLTNEFLQARIKKIEEYVSEEYPKLELVAIEGQDEDPEKAFAAAQNIISAHPNVKSIMANTSTGLGPVAKAIEEEGKIGEIYASGLSSPLLAKAAFESGAAKSAVLWDTAAWASFAMTVAANLVEGKDMPEGDNVQIDGFPNATREGSNYYYWETFVFTEDNVDDFNF